MTGLWLVSYVALWILLLAIALVLVSLMRNLGVIYTSLKGLAPTLEPPASSLKAGQVLPDVTWQTLAGDSRAASEFKGIKLAFALVSPSCKPCVDYLQQLGAEGRDADPLDPSVKRRVVVSLGDQAGTLGLLDRVHLPDGVAVLMDRNHEIAEKWGITITPSTVIVDEELRVVRQLFGIDSTSHVKHGHEAFSSSQHSAFGAKGQAGG